MGKTVLHRSFFCLILSGPIEFLKGNTVSFSRVRPASAGIDQNFCLLPVFFQQKPGFGDSEKGGGKKQRAV